MHLNPDKTRWNFSTGIYENMTKIIQKSLIFVQAIEEY